MERVGKVSLSLHSIGLGLLVDFLERARGGGGGGRGGCTRYHKW